MPDTQVSQPPPRRVLDAFGLTGEPEPLPGGQGRAFRVGGAVLKPTDDPLEAEWSAGVMRGVARGHGFAVPEPLRVGTGRHVAHGWTATALVAGAPGPSGRWGELLTAARAFHAALARVPRPGFLERRRHPWAVADRVAWAEQSADTGSEAAAVLTRLLRLRRPVEMPSQIVHGDLTGNVLFAEGGDPVIIDFSPYWRPAAYAEAVVVADGLLYHPGEVPVADVGDAGAQWTQMLVRALVFRLVAACELAGPGGRIPEEEIRRFTAAAAVVAARAATAGTGRQEPPPADGLR
ncbi:uncharacterized protein (TIGR02569 family) [Spinactinospora alkalitolerans]|uniref:Uncharacterized protein (TIGR02569 family) n=1 Tax=Spinactinospora alkalitolerans TaxID=687207 RepID=A0A852TZQ4_9ACTN|nr:phosphotransferase [Spinactinospora alkalitolerans]NYE47444.1 uncharacterized protein (TIGR02569 family) [Spinactinospora alkalitolerans]